MKRSLTIAAALITLVLLTYSAVRGHEFVDYDDHVYILQDPLVTGGISWRSIGLAFTQAHRSQWTPLSQISLQISHALHGEEPAGYHVTNVLLHALSSALLFLALQRLTGSAWRSAFAAAVFAVHPLHVESVAWAASRKDCLSGLFWMLTLWAYVRYTEQPARQIRHALVTLCLAAGMLSKPTVVTLPFVLLLLDHWPLRRFGREALVEKLPWFALSALISYFTYYFQSQAGAMEYGRRIGFDLRLSNAAMAYWDYLRLTFWPTDLAVFYAHPLQHPEPVRLVCALGLLALLSFAAWRQRHTRPHWIVGWLWYLGTLVPVIGLVQVGLQARADRYTYLPQIGITLALVWSLPRPRPGLAPRLLWAALGTALIASLSLLSMRQIGTWSDSIRLFERVLAVEPDNAYAHQRLATVRLRQAEFEKAEFHYRRSYELDPAAGRKDLLRFHLGTAEMLARNGRVDEAIARYRAAVELDPTDLRANALLGQALVAGGRAHEARPYLEFALREQPGVEALQAALEQARAAEEKAGVAPVAPAATLASQRPSLLLVTFDTTRADHIGAYGAGEARTVTIDRLAREGLLFEQATSVAPSTLPAHTSILTGVDPHRHGVRDNGIFRLLPQAESVTESLRAAGWRTGAFVGALVLDRRYGLDQGFEVYRQPEFAEDASFYSEQSARAVVDQTLEWLQDLDPAQPFFAWVHFYDPHQPWKTADGLPSTDPSAYAAEIAFSDEQLGRLLDWIGRHRRDPLLTIVTADHGEGLGEHGEKTHGFMLYESTLRVPLVVHGPPVAEFAGRRVAQPVSLLQIAPTLLAAAGLPADRLPAAQQPGLLAVAGNEATSEPIYLETLLPFHSYRWRASRGLRWKNHKLIVSGPSEFYDLASDPAERSDLSPRQTALQSELAERLARISAEPELGWSTAQEIGALDAQRLETLGYVVGSTGGDPFSPELPHVRDRVDFLERFDHAMVLVHRAIVLAIAADPRTWIPEHKKVDRDLLREAQQLLRELEREEPDNLQLLARLGTVEVVLGNYADAVPVLERALRGRSASVPIRADLARALWRVGRHADARRVALEALELEPGNPHLQIWLKRHPLPD